MKAAWIAALTLCLTSCAASAPGGDQARAQQALAPFKQALQAALQAGLADGPPAAIEVCRVEAPRIAAGHSTGAIRMGRTSHRLRNPANAGPDWTAPLLAAYLANPDDRAPRTLHIDSARIGYAEPIVTQPLCTSCHGPVLAPAVAELLAARYPEDQATGFQAGSLRGIFWVEIPVMR